MTTTRRAQIVWALVLCFCTSILLACQHDSEEDNQTTCIRSAHSSVWIAIYSKDGSLFDHSQLQANKGIQATGERFKKPLPIYFCNQAGETCISLQTELPEQPKMIDDGKAKSITRTSGASLQLGKQHFDLVFTYRFVFRERLKYSYDPSLSVPDVFIETVTCNGREIGSGSPTNIPTIVFQEKLDGLFDVCSLEWQLHAPRRQATER